MLTSSNRFLPFLVEPDRVLYSDPNDDNDSGAAQSLHFLYLCRTCRRLRSLRSVRFHIEGYFCPQCLESYTHSVASSSSTLATLQADSLDIAKQLERGRPKQRCVQCFRCPLTLTPLSLRATLQKRGDEERKSFTLQSDFSLYSSTADSGLAPLAHKPSQTHRWDLLAAAARPDLHADELRIGERLALLMRDCQRQAIDERTERERVLQALEQPPTTRPTRHRSSSARLSESFQRLSLSAPFEGDGDQQQPTIVAGPTRPARHQQLPFTDEEVCSLPKRHSERSTIGQRLAEPSHQLVEASELLPSAMPLRSKIALRCGECESALLVPRYTGHSSDIRISRNAQRILPMIRLQHPLPTLRVGERCPLYLALSNPLHQTMRLRLTQIRDDFATRPSSLPAPEAYVPMLELPKRPVRIARRDIASAGGGDTTDADDDDSENDPDVIVKRDLYRVVLRLHVVPSTPEQHYTAFNVSFDYCDDKPPPPPTSPPGDKQPSTPTSTQSSDFAIQFRVDINIAQR